ncbi:MAG: MFS transporter [Pseudomonadota bacterium]|nr:MFS transporter [Pseudomonadota bacterium]
MESSAGVVQQTPLSPKFLNSLLFGNFVIGSGVMVVAGTLRDMARSLNAAPSDLGVLISAASLTICIAAPVLAALVGKWDRRHLLTLCMLWYAVLHLAEAFAPSLETLLPLRVASMLAPALFSPQAAACVGWLARADQRGRAVTYVFLGWSAASVLGMPLSAWAGDRFGWRATFMALSLLSLISAVWLARAMPSGIRPPPLNLRAWGLLARNPVLTLCVLASALFSGGQFMLLAYFSPFFRDEVGLGPTQLSLLFAWFGILSFVGNAVASRYVDRIGADRVLLMALGCIAISLVLWPLTRNPTLLWPVIAPWALAIFVANTAQQSRLVGLAPGAATATVAFNASAMYGGQAIGAAWGALLLATHHVDQMHWYALAAVVIAMVLSIVATALRHRHGLHALGPRAARGG